MRLSRTIHALIRRLPLVWGLLVFSNVYAEEPSEQDIGIVQVLQSDIDALHEIFGDSDSLSCDTLTVSDSLRHSLEVQLQRGIHDSMYVIYTVHQHDGAVSLAIVAEEQGKYRPITFMAGIDSDFRVLDVRVLVYRESRGGEVQRSRFLKQYRGKDIDDPVRINRDIINITGATVSVRALNAGVRKCLAIAAIYHHSRESR